MNPKFKHRSGRRRSIYILPNIFTTLSLFFGFYSILASADGRFSMAAWYILFAALCDGLDGTVARMTNTTSRFGMEYDSLCDLVSFGLAPAFLAYFWALTPENLAQLAPYNNRLGAAISFIYLACGALRLARFNVFSETRSAGFFQGLPIPGGALVVVAAVLWHYRFGQPPISPDGLTILILVLVVAVLMVSNFDYCSHKNRTLFNNGKPFETLVVVVLIFGLMLIKLKSSLLPVLFLYLVSGPIVTIIRAHRSRKKGDEPDYPPDKKPQASKTTNDPTRNDQTRNDQTRKT